MENLPRNYGYVVLTAIAAGVVNMGIGIQVVRARKRYNVKYPKMYSNENNGINTFNCIQRAHQNILENHPQFLAMLLLGGIKYPKICAGAGMVYIAGKILYTMGYSTGEPEKRKWGGLSYIGLLTILGCCIKMAYDNLVE